MKTISRYIMTLALLLTAVTGAWAEETPLVTINASSEFKSGSKTFDNKVTVTFSNEVAFIADNGWCAVAAGNKTLTVEPVDGVTITRVKFYTTLGNAEDITAPFEAIMNSTYVYVSGNPQNCFHVSVNGSRIGAEDTHNYLQRIEIYGTAEPPLTVTWNASAKTGNFAMPGSDVVLTPIYAKAATFATTGSGSEMTTLLPEAAEGVIAGTEASLIAEGTGIVAFAGTSTDVKQGTLMYAIGTSATQAPALTAFSATVPTAKDYDDAATLYVWYYIKGADTPDGQQATEENTFNDTEPACLTVTVLTNKFNIQFNAANANTIEAGKATVTVDGTAATVTDGKLQGVKMGSEVKLKANTGYKFRKVEVKKKEAAEALPALSITNPSVGQVIGSDGKNYTSGTLPTGVTAVAKICYVDGDGHGLALALTDEVGELNWSTAQTTCAAHTPAFTGGTWKLATKDEWNSMFNAAGSYDDLREGFGFVGGTNMQSDGYWSSTEYEDDSDKAWLYDFHFDYWFKVSKGVGYYVRACLAF